MSMWKKLIIFQNHLSTTNIFLITILSYGASLYKVLDILVLNFQSIEYFFLCTFYTLCELLDTFQPDFGIRQKSVIFPGMNLKKEHFHVYHFFWDAPFETDFLHPFA